MKALELLKDYRNIDFGCNMDGLHNEIDEAIEELEAFKNRSCLNCEHKIGCYMYSTLLDGTQSVISCNDWELNNEIIECLRRQNEK